MLPLSAAAFFAWEFAALLYQVIWQRLLVLFSGADLFPKDEFDLSPR